MDRSRCSSTGSRHRRSSLKDWEFLNCMNELDETVASIAEIPHYNRRQRGFTEDGSIGTNNTLTTDFGHHVLTRKRVEIGGIEQVKNSGPTHRRSKSLASHRSRGSQRSKGSLSLEQLISETILRTSPPDHFDDLSGPSHLRRTSSTEDILKDLQQADAVLASEGVSVHGNLLPPPISYDEDEPDLLPPMIDSIEWQNPPNDTWQLDHTQWADWSEWQSPNKKQDTSCYSLGTPCQNSSGESGEKTWHTFDTETETSMFSDPFWTDFQENPFEQESAFPIDGFTAWP